MKPRSRAARARIVAADLGTLAQDRLDWRALRGKLPGVAPVAKQQGAHVARVIAAQLAGGAPPGPFRYKDQGSLAIVGRAKAVASLPHLRLTGLPAWLLWSCVHLVLLNGLRNRVLVYVQWVSAWLTHGRGALLMTTCADGLRRAEADRRGNAGDS